MKLVPSKAPIFCLKENNYDVDIENCPPQELDKTLQRFYVEVCNLFCVTLCSNDREFIFVAEL